MLCKEHNTLSLKSAINNGALRAAIFGANDGLVSNLSLIMAVAGAGTSAKIILLTGISGLLAGAFSMAIGEFISMKIQRETAEKLINIEREEIEEFPEEEFRELQDIYIQKGIEPDKAKKLSKLIMDHKELALETHAREELGLNTEELGSPIQAALSSFFSFAAGAIIPLLPYLIFNGNLAFFLSLVFSALTLLIVGGALANFTEKGRAYGAIRMLCLGAIAGFVTYVSGYFFQAIAG